MRRKGQELEKKREELLDLQDFTEDIIHSMRGGLITTDMEGRIVLLNRTGEEILGYRFADIRGRKLSEFSEAFWPPGMPEMKDKLSLRREIEFRTPMAGNAIWESAFRPCVPATTSAADTSLIFRT